jgi:hypothetical protein
MKNFFEHCWHVALSPSFGPVALWCCGHRVGAVVYGVAIVSIIAGAFAICGLCGGLFALAAIYLPSFFVHLLPY